MTLLLAPMEGLLDFTLRDVLTRAGGIDRCVSEFIRITDQLLPERVFLRIVPELLNGSRTPAGVPVRAQLLGSDPACLADNAARLAGLGPAGIDLNFGCPAKVVNRHGGGASLLDEPELLTRIASAVRRAVPAQLPVSAKMRLGTQDDSRAVECAQALADGGVDEIVVHARTKAHGYKPPAYWDRIADIRAAVAVPLVANGEIWTVADALRCREASGCHALMLGRGMVADPGLALAILATLRGEPPETLPTARLGALLRVFWAQVEAHIEPRARAGRLKQWLNYLRRSHPLAGHAYAALRTENDSRRLAERLFQLFPADPPGPQVAAR
jgi:tRNA-dihydrouridine synthase C